MKPTANQHVAELYEKVLILKNILQGVRLPLSTRTSTCFRGYSGYQCLMEGERNARKAIFRHILVLSTVYYPLTCSFLVDNVEISLCR